jgi:hypothetical protein
MAAEPTSLGIGIIMAGVMAFFLWIFRRLRRRVRKRLAVVR